MDRWQQKLIVELEELNYRVENLKNFTSDPTGDFVNLPKEERALLREQYAAMRRYQMALESRVARAQRDKSLSKLGS